jgi:hypothetical protein
MEALPAGLAATPVGAAVECRRAVGRQFIRLR